MIKCLLNWEIINTSIVGSEKGYEMLHLHHFLQAEIDFDIVIYSDVDDI